MSLQLWLPLIGDVKNQGLTNYEISTLGTLSWVDGKLGSSAMRAGDGTQIINGIKIEETFTNLLNSNYSVSVWVKPYGTHIHYNGSIFSSGNWNTSGKRWAFGVSQDNSKVDVLCSDYNTYITCAVPADEWTHLVCTCGDDRIVKLYKNGEYISSINRSSSNSFDSDTTFSCVGREAYANGYFSFNGAIQDFRLYDHCLSQMEVKELAKGLILHYPLNRQGWGQENLLKNSYTKYDNNGYYVGTYAFADPSKLETGKTYTLSFNGELQDDSQTGWYFNIFPSPYTAIINKTTDKEGRFAFSFVMPENGGNRTSIGCYSMPLGNRLGCAIWNIKLEEGSVATPWCPNSSDALATTIGLNGTTEYDCSGFCNNGTRTGAFSWTSDTPKYSVSQYFNGSSYSKTDSGTFSWFAFDKCTVAIWMKPTTLPSSWAGTFGIAHDNSSTNKSFVIGNYGGKFTVQSANGSWVNIQASDLPINEWHHCVATLDDTTIKMYMDGELVKTYIINWGATTVASDTRIQVGIDLPGSDEVYQGYYSDARIYATALSASDVKSLYQNCATIDSDGTIRGQIRS